MIRCFIGKQAKNSAVEDVFRQYEDTDREVSSPRLVVVIICHDLLLECSIFLLCCLPSLLMDMLEGVGALK